MRWELDKKEIDELFLKARVGHLGTVDQKGQPYVIPVGYNYIDGVIYLHVSEQSINRTGKTGKKIENIRRNPQVCFEVMVLEPADSIFRSVDWGGGASVIALGRAEKVMDEQEKTEVFGELGLKGAVYKIKPEQVTGKTFTMRYARGRAKNIKEKSYVSE